MSYDKYLWTSEKIKENLFTPERLRHLETQYELALPGARVNNTELIVEIGAGTAAAGNLRFDNGVFYGYNGTAWVQLGL